MLQHGSGDISFPISQARAELDKAEPPKFFVTLAGGDHSNAYRTGPLAERSAQTALHFFDFVLKDRSSALDELTVIEGVEAVT
jgi:hypothetical protein